MKKTLKGIVCLLIFAVGFYFGVRVGEHMTKQKMAEILNVTKVENSTKENKVGVSDLTDAKDDKKEAKAEVDDNTIYDKESGLFCDVDYDFKTELCSMSPWHK